MILYLTQLESEFTALCHYCHRFALDRRGSTAGLSLYIWQGSLFSRAQGQHSISESASESMRNSSHSSHRHIGEVPWTTLVHLIVYKKTQIATKTSYQATRVIPTTPGPLSHIAGRQQWTEDEADNDKGELSQSLGSLPNRSIMSLRFPRSSDIPSIRLSLMGTLTSFEIGFCLSSSHSLANALVFDRCWAIEKPVWLD